MKWVTLTVLPVLCASNLQAQTVEQERREQVRPYIEALGDWGGVGVDMASDVIIYVDLDEGTPQFTFLLGARRIALGNGRYRVWVRTNYQYDQTDVYPAYRSTLGQEEYDCVTKRIRYGRGVHYDAAGKVVLDGSGNLTFGTWREPMPGTIGEVMLNNACIELRKRR